MPPPKKQSSKPAGAKGKNAGDKPAEEPSKGTGGAKRGGASGSGGRKPGGGNHAPGTDATGPSRNDVRTLVSGSSSWTGKLPMTLWSEHCQKQKWQKPEYGMRKVRGGAAAAGAAGADAAAGDATSTATGSASPPPDAGPTEGFVAWAMVTRKNPKNGETVSVTLRAPSDREHLLVRPTAAEARHMAATYALFRVGSGRNTHTMLPAGARDVWRELLRLKDADLAAGQAWLYRDDPFAARAEHEAEQAARRKRREDAELDRKKRAETDAAAKMPALGEPQSKGGDAGWGRAPAIELGRRRRVEVEATVRRHARWNRHGETMSAPDKKAVVDELGRAGFRASHVREAAERCKDRHECLDWLLIHVPEDDLPPWAFPREYRAGISVASTDLARENALLLLAKGGYPSATCAAAYDKRAGDALAAAADLQSTLDPDASKNNGEPDANAAATWDEEMRTLEAVFDTRFSRSSDATCSVTIDIEGSPYTLVASRSGSYPLSPPIVALHGALPAYIKLKIYQAALKNAREAFLGEVMVYSIVDWVETNAPGIIADPGSLLEISAATGGAAEHSTTDARTNQRRKGRRRALIRNEAQDSAILQDYETRKNQKPYQEMHRKRQALPAWALREEIISKVRKHQVTIISGETGSGKSTQVVQFVLEDMIEAKNGSATNIVCTQPRRIAALGLADRVSVERCTNVGDEVGYSIRGESKQTMGRTKISFVTTGVLLRRFQGLAEVKASLQEALSDISHVVVDEVHERDLDTDFLLTLLRQVAATRRDLKIILMSATIDAALFKDYFSSVTAVASAHIPGRTFPITDYFLDDALQLSGYQMPAASAYKGKGKSRAMPLNYELIGSTISAVHKSLKVGEGGILVFLPGVAEINRTMDSVRGTEGLHLLPLHAALMPSEQRLVFQKTPPGKRKVVVATNIAETSITVEDIVVVIDCGKVKQTSYDPESHMVKLEEMWISKAAAMQRRGRAGRVRDGVCYKLYSRDTAQHMVERPGPEITRTPLEQLFLMTRAMGIVDVHSFLSGAITPPSIAALDKAQAMLRSIGALDGSHLTALGEHLAHIPADIRIGKLLVYGALFGCLNHCLSIASILAAKSPFISSRDLRTECMQARTKFSEGHGDLIGDMRAFEEWHERRRGSSAETRQWIAASYLSWPALQDIQTNRTQFISSLREIGFLGSARQLDEQGSRISMPLLRAVVAGSFYPQIARIQLPDKKYASTVSGTFGLDPEAKSIKYFLKESGRAFIHPSSSLFDAQGYGDSLYMSYFTSMATDKMYIRDLTPFNAYALLMFCGNIALDTKGRGLILDDWIKLQGWARIGVLSSRLRSLLDDILARHFEDPSGIAESQESKDVIGCVQGLLQYNGLDN